MFRRTLCIQQTAQLALVGCGGRWTACEHTFRKMASGSKVYVGEHAVCMLSVPYNAAVIYVLLRPQGLAAADRREPALGHCREGPGGRVHSLWDAALCVDRAQAAWFWCASTSAPKSSWELPRASSDQKCSKRRAAVPAASTATAHHGSLGAGLDEPITAGHPVNLATSTAPEPSRCENSACISSASANSFRTSPRLRFA